MQPTPIAVAAGELGIDVWSPQRISEIAAPLRNLQAELFVVASYGKILPQALLEIPARGAFNVHPSLLPLYRGATPLQAQIRDMCRETGVTIIAMDAGMDTGDILLQERTALGERETLGELEPRLAQLGAAALLRAISLEREGRLARVPQAGLASEREIAVTLTRPLRTADLQVDWSASAPRVAAFVRSLSPRPAARATIGEVPCKILAARPVPDAGGGAAPGTPLRAGRGIAIACGEGAVEIEHVVPQSRAAMTGEAFAASFFARSL